MPLIGYLLILISGLGVALFAILQYRQAPRLGKLIIQLTAVALIFLAVLEFFGLPGNLVAKGPEQDQEFLVAVAAIYICIVLGMLAEVFYTWFGKPRATRRRAKFDWGAILQPLFVSPIVLIPTIAALQNAHIDLMKLDFPRLMILLIAFQNGFLWRLIVVKTTAAANADARQPSAAAKKAGEQ